MRGRLSFLTGAALGYVLGAKAGRGRYEQIKSQADTLWHDPRVQDKVGQAQSFVAETGGAVVGAAKEKAPDLQSKLGDAAGAAKAKVADVTGGKQDDASGVTYTGAGAPPAGQPMTARAGDDDDLRDGMTPHSEQGQ